MLVTTLCLLVPILIWWFFPRDRHGYISGFSVTAIIVSCILGLFVAIGYGVQANQGTRIESNLLSLSDGRVDSSSGDFAFFVGSYKTEDEFKFTFYREDRSTGQIKLEDVRAAEVTVVQDIQPGQKPYVKHGMVCEKRSEIWRWQYCEGSSIGNEYELHIPAGTIKQDIALDAK